MQNALGVFGVALGLVACTSTTKRSVDHDDDDSTTGAAVETSTANAGGTGGMGGPATSSATSGQSSAETTVGPAGGGAGERGTGGDGGTGGGDGGTAGTDGTPVPTCETHGEQCDPNSSCSNTDVGIECTCAPDYEDVAGDGHECVEKCAAANCSVDANCRIIDGEAECSCKAGFTGDGVTCKPDPDCASLGCAEIAQCVEMDSILTCQCPEGFDDDGVGPDGCTSCAVNHDLVDEYCVDEQLVNCVDNSPSNSSPSVTSVTITYDDDSGWSTPDDCDWECNADYALEAGSCIDSKQVACVDNAPNHATSTPGNTTINYTDADGWSNPANCGWQCDAGYDRQSGQCVSECLTDNGGCDPLTACSLDSDGVVCGACPEHYTGSGDTECLPVPRCDPSKPFGMAFAVGSVNLADEVEYSMLSKDGLSLYVQYLDSPDVYRATRDNLYEDFGTPAGITHFDAILSSYPDAQLLSMTADGRTVYFMSNFLPFEATRSNTTQQFGSVVQRAELQNASELPLIGLWVSPSGERIYGFVLVNYYLATAVRSGSSFGPLTRVGNSITSHYTVTLSGDELTMYWAVTGGDPSEGSGDIWRAERTSTANDFSGEEHFANLNGSLWDEPVWISDDDCELYLQRRNSGLGTPSPDAGDGIFVARRPL